MESPIPFFCFRPDYPRLYTFALAVLGWSPTIAGAPSFPFLTDHPNGALRNRGWGHRRRMIHMGKNNSRLFHDQIILYGFDPLDAPCDFIRFIDGLLRINEAAQLHRALEGFNTDLE